LKKKGGKKMKKQIVGLLAIIVVAIVGIAVFATTTAQTTTSTTTSAPQPRSIEVAGSTTVLPIATAAAEAWMNAHPSDTITVAGGGSGVGISSLLAGTCDIADSSRSITDNERKGRNGVALVDQKIAIDAVCVIVNPSNPVNGLTMDQFKQILTGKITNWIEVGGENLPIAVYTRESTSGTYDTVQKIVLGSDNVTLSAITVNSNGEMAQAIGGNPNGIGYVGIGYLAGNSSIKGLTLNGIAPSEKTARDFTYPITRYLYMVTVGQPTGLENDWINFILSTDGQKIVENQGFISLNPM
jgi:phosphate transport system substrate-binding protein